MDFKLTEEQQQLRDTLVKLIAKDYSFDKRHKILKSEAGWSREAWKQFADMGILALGLPEEHGGIPATAFDTAVVMEVFGRGIVVEPYLATVVLGAKTLADLGSEKQQAEILPGVATGDVLLAYAHDEPGARYELNRVSTTAKRSGSGWILNGAKTVVLHGAQADHLIVSARTGGGERDKTGISLFLVPRGAKGLGVRDVKTHDGMRAAELSLKDVTLGTDALLGKDGDGYRAIERAQARAIGALTAEAVGNMGALLEITLAYLKTRKQFGMPIGAFQVLQHRMADMLMQAEQARSMSYLAADRCERELNEETLRALSAAKAQVGQAGRFVGQQAVQLHGGIGVTDEVNVSHYFKRLTVINAQFGDADHHLGRFSDLLAIPAVSAGKKAAA